MGLLDKKLISDLKLNIVNSISVGKDADRVILSFSNKNLIVVTHTENTKRIYSIPRHMTPKNLDRKVGCLNFDVKSFIECIIYEEEIEA